MTLFRRDIEARCVYCARGGALGGGQIICAKRGVVAEGASCRSFVYDPLKRVPPPPAVLKRDYNEDELKF